MLESCWRGVEEELPRRMPMLAKTLFTGGEDSLIEFLVFPLISLHLCRSTNRSKWPKKSAPSMGKATAASRKVHLY